MHPQKKMVSMQKILNPSQYRSNGSATLSKENFARVIAESLSKAINSREAAPKEKHVRKLLIGTYQTESGAFFWQYLPILRLKEDQIVCWKFCHVLHKMIRDGHRSVLSSCYDMRQVLLDCGNLWRHVEDGYGKLIFSYCTLLFNRINFLKRNPRFPNDLKVTDEQLNDIGEQDPNIFFDFSCEIFDALDDILQLQEQVLASLEIKRQSSMTKAGQCHLAPMIACIQDSSMLYDYSVKILFKLHGSLPSQTLEGHRQRFLCQHKALKGFYINTSNLQYSKTLIQIPYLTDQPPNFLDASNLKRHVAPQVVMISSPERDSPDHESQAGDNSQILVNLSEDPHQDLSSLRSNDTTISNDTSIDTRLSDSASAGPSTSDVALSGIITDMKTKIQTLESTIDELRDKLELERARHLSTKESLTADLNRLKLENEELCINKESQVKKLREELSILRYQANTAKSSVDKIQEECKRAQHDNEICQEALKKLVKDLSDLKTENANLRQHPVAAPPEVNKGNDKLVDELSKRVDELSSKLSERDNQSQEWFKERELLVSTKTKLEQQLDSHQEDLLMAEMNETDKIIKEATKRIEELSEKSRKHESGIKLQVNEKISGVCYNLMKAVRNLIVQSRILQREIVGDDEKASANNEFYKRNSSWTEGLISAANVVAMAAKSLVDSADLAMSGQAKYSELAAAAHEIAAATTQLVVASRVKAKQDSEKLKILTAAAKQVNQCTSNVVDTARVCAELIEQEIDKVDISSLSLHQTKKLEMESQVKLLELEDQLSKERTKLGLLRRQHYEQEAQSAPSANK